MADQAIEVTAAMTQAQSALLFELLEREQVDLVFIKSPVEFDVLGSQRPALRRRVARLLFGALISPPPTRSP